jgi:anthranilate synthase component 1
LLLISSKEGDGFSNLTDEELKKCCFGKKHCFRGDVFQLVLSRDLPSLNFNVYRIICINPSPYLFFFDYGDFKIFGSSPRSSNYSRIAKAEIHPIAGTFKRTGDDEKMQPQTLSEDKKEIVNMLC